MPTYGYECLSCKEQFETVQRITEDALKIHDNCGGKLREAQTSLAISPSPDGDVAQAV